jgi:DNA-binding SARP family transcriptional activator/TolB-like protein
MIISQSRAAPRPVADAADPVAVRLRLIGQMEASIPNGESILPPGRKTRALLAIIALSAPRPMLRSRLAELLWSRRPEEQARASLRQEIHRLLEVLTPAGKDVLAINRDSLALRPGVVWVDVEEVLRATTTHPASLALLDGELLEELDGVDPAFDGWLQTERERLRDRARSVGETLLTEQGSPEALIVVAQQLLSIDRAHEGAWRALMRAHAERGERGMAIQSYDRCRAVLADLLDATPSSETQALLADIRTGRTARLAAPAPSLPPELRPEPRSASPRAGAKLGVLPLTLVGMDETEAHLALGLAEEITSALQKVRWLFLVSTGSLAQLVQQGRDDVGLRRAFGLDFVLDGLVQRVGRRFRITLRLVDLRDGSQIVWARRFDRQTSDLLTLQEEVAAEVTAQIDPEILAIESRRAAHRPASDSAAYDLLLRALPGLARLEREHFMQSGQWLRQAILLEPDFAAPYAWYACWTGFLVNQSWAKDRDAAVNDAAHHAERAVTLDPQDAKVLTIAGHVRASLQRRVREGIALHERALGLNPNLAMAWALAGLAHLYLGDWEEGERRLLRYKRLAPTDPHAFHYDTGFSLVALAKRDYEAVVVTGRNASEMNPAFSGACEPYLAALGFLGQAQEAAVVRRRLLAIDPNFSIELILRDSPYERIEDREHLARGLRLAGVAEGDAGEGEGTRLRGEELMPG